MARTEFRIGGQPVAPTPEPKRPVPPNEPSAERADDSADAAPAGEGTLRDKVVAALRTVYDPEIPLNIYDLGLIYDVQIDDETKNVHVTMTLTSPACPVAQDLPLEARAAVERVPEVNKCELELTFDPPWSMDNLSDEAKLQLGFL